MTKQFWSGPVQSGFYPSPKIFCCVLIYIAFLQTERRKAEQLNFERVIEEGTSVQLYNSDYNSLSHCPATNNAFSGQNKLISAVEAVLHKHLRESLTVHEQYHQVSGYIMKVHVTVLM